MAGYIGSKAVSLNVTSGDILGDVGVGGDVSVTTGDGAILNLQTSDTTVTDGSVLGAINFTAPSEGSGTDAILLGAAIEAVSEGTFAADNNATELVFKTGATAVADTKLTLSSGGRLQLNSKHQNAISNAQTAFDNAGFRINTFNGAGSNVGVSVGHTSPNIITIQGCYNEGSTAPLAINPYGGATTIGNGLTLTDGNLTVASGHGIDFAATGNVSGTSSELLNDYEEGTFSGSTNSSNLSSLTFSERTYTKIGRRVFINMRVAATVDAADTRTFISTVVPIASASNSYPFSGGGGSERGSSPYQNIALGCMDASGGSANAVYWAFIPVATGAYTFELFTSYET